MKSTWLTVILAAALLPGCSGNGDTNGGAGEGSGAEGGKASAAFVRNIREGKSATFEARHEFRLMAPAGTKKARIWFTMPQEDPAQEVSGLRVECAQKHEIVTDRSGNRLIHVVAENPGKEVVIVATFTVTRREQIAGPDAAKARPLSDAEKKDLAAELAPNAHVIIDDGIRSLSKQIVGAETNPVIAARKIYDWVLANIEYWVKNPLTLKASPVGSTEYCLSTKTGNCTDFHSLWTSLARAAGIPTRMVYGSFFKKELDGKDADQSYHCWPEFYVSGIGWIPHDVAVADIFVGDFQLNKDNEGKVRLTTADGYTAGDPAKVEYYFGNLEERRVTWSRGRDLELTPKQDGGPVNALAKAYVELDGVAAGEKSADGTVIWSRKLTFTEKK
ncbi:MAG: transglutaminase domain-containing protein [Candidatus Brocadiae bacterium]|nr:transglutaminase domain-containing protein [Candidatus Brocadiia bacterium]